MLPVTQRTQPRGLEAAVNLRCGGLGKFRGWALGSKCMESESAYLIWVLRCERIIQEKSIAIARLTDGGSVSSTRDSPRIK